MKVMIVGAGKKAREILDRLGHSWIVTLVDRDREKLELMGKRYDQVTKTVEGDASSNLILSKAGIEDQEFVAAVTNRDDVNLEVCRMAKEEGVKQVIAVASDSRNVKKFVDLGVRVVSDSFLVAREVQLYFENPQISVSTIGKGKGEVMEIEVTRNAPVVGKKIGELGSKNWMIAAIQRGDDLIIHHDHSATIEAGDRVTVVGHEDLYHAIYHIFKLDQPSFPLRYGQNVLLSAKNLSDIDSTLHEATYLVRNTKAQKVTIFVPGEIGESLEGKFGSVEEGTEIEIRIVEGSYDEEVTTASVGESVGCVLTPPVSSSKFLWMFGKEKIMSLARDLGAPLVISRGSLPYQRILVPYNGTRDSAMALEIAHDIASQLDGEISIIVVSEPGFIRGDEPANWAVQALDHAREISRIYRIPIKEIRRKGNRAKEVIKVSSSFDLLIIGATSGDAPFLKPEVGELIAGESSCSVIILPSSG